MQTSTLKALEFDAVREALAQHALTPLGVEGQSLDPLQLTALARFAESVDNVVRGIRTREKLRRQRAKLRVTLMYRPLPLQ